MWRPRQGVESQCPSVRVVPRSRPVSSHPLYFMDPKSPPSGPIAFSYSPCLPGSSPPVGPGGPLPPDLVPLPLRVQGRFKPPHPNNS